MYCIWLASQTTAPQQNTRGWHLILLGAGVSLTLFVALHLLTTRALWRQAEVGKVAFHSRCSVTRRQAPSPCYALHGCRIKTDTSLAF